MGALTILSLTLIPTIGSADDPCTRLLHHDAGTVVDVFVNGAIMWEGAPITHSKFDRYLRLARATKPYPLFRVRWIGREKKSAAALISEIRTHGLEVAVDCPPIPW